MIQWNRRLGIKRLKASRDDICALLPPHEIDRKERLSPGVEEGTRQPSGPKKSGAALEATRSPFRNQTFESKASYIFRT
jgi:hypothetical protein